MAACSLPVSPLTDSASLTFARAAPAWPWLASEIAACNGLPTAGLTVAAWAVETSGRVAEPTKAAPPRARAIPKACKGLRVIGVLIPQCGVRGSCDRMCRQPRSPLTSFHISVRIDDANFDRIAALRISHHLGDRIVLGEPVGGDVDLVLLFHRLLADVVEVAVERLEIDRLAVPIDRAVEVHNDVVHDRLDQRRLLVGRRHVGG